MHLPNRLHAPAILQTLQVVADPVQFLDTCAQRYGDTFTTRVLGFNSPPVVFFGNPKALQ
ncbi:MAG: cytochrome P450, partial [Desertifilum sp. SIO1I2]|nr:cytochrome P450 [Desertifilum sp. SIO1I2]